MAARARSRRRRRAALGPAAMAAPSKDESGLEAYGRLTEGLHVAGYSFGRACANLEWLLEGDRWKLEGRFADVNAFMESLRLGDFRQAAESRKCIVARIKELQPAVSNRQIARTLGVDEKTLRNDAAENSAPDEKKISKSNDAESNAAENSAPIEFTGEHAAALIAAVERGDVSSVPDFLKPRLVHRALGEGNSEWYTPDTARWPIIKLVRAVLGTIDLDPTSSEIAQRTVCATKFFTKADDGLKHEWWGKVFLNPPYSNIVPFIETLIAEFQAGRVTEAILLTHNYTDTQWFHRAAKAASIFCLTLRRIPFLDPDGEPASAQGGQCFFYFGKRTDVFAAHFAAIGLVSVPLADLREHAPSAKVENLIG